MLFKRSDHFTKVMIVILAEIPPLLVHLGDDCVQLRRRARNLPEAKDQLPLDHLPNLLPPSVVASPSSKIDRVAERLGRPVALSGHLRVVYRVLGFRI